MTKQEQLISMIDNYGQVLEDDNTIDEIIMFVSNKIYEANENTCNKGYFYEDDF